jgi:PKD repeat protein
VAVALVALLLGGLGVGVSEVRAQLPYQFPTRDLVVAGGTLTLAVTTSNVHITGTSGLAPCTTTAIFPVATVTYTCPSQLSAGSIIGETFDVLNGPITETVTYNANGPQSLFPPSGPPTVEPLVTCFNLNSPFTCSGTTSVQTIPGGTLTITITPGFGGVTVQINPGPNQIGTCVPLAGVVSAPGPTATLTYTCAAGTGQFVPVGVVSGINVLQIPATVALAPTMVITDNANAPIGGLPGSPFIPSPGLPQTLTIGTVAAPTLATISPSSGPAGTSVTLTGTNLSGATAINFGTTPGTSVNCSTGTSCTVTAPTLAPNTAANVTVVTPGGTSNALSFTFGATTPIVPANVAFVNPPTSGSVGQSVTFTPATATTTASCGSITSYKIDFGDGSPVQTSATPSATTHTYTSPGTFTVTLTVTDCAGGVASTSTTIAISGPAGPAIAVAAGWNLVSGPSGSVFSQCNGPLYTFQAGNTAYQVVPNTSGIVNGQGYWCFLNAPTTLSLNGQGTTSASISAPPSQWVMVGNPSATQTLTVRGADSVVTWNPGTGAYVQASVIVPGQGAWAISLNGGTITVSP